MSMALTKADMAESLFNELGLNKREAVNSSNCSLRICERRWRVESRSSFPDRQLRPADRTNGRAGIQKRARKSNHGATCGHVSPRTKTESRVEAYAGAGDNDELPPIPANAISRSGKSAICAR